LIILVVNLIAGILTGFIKSSVYLFPGDPSNDIDYNIKDNFKKNFKAFKDNDKNGLPD